MQIQRIGYQLQQTTLQWILNFIYNRGETSMWSLPSGINWSKQFRHWNKIRQTPIGSKLSCGKLIRGVALARADNQPIHVDMFEHKGIGGTLSPYPMGTSSLGLRVKGSSSSFDDSMMKPAQLPKGLQGQSGCLGCCTIISRSTSM